MTVGDGTQLDPGLPPGEYRLRAAIQLERSRADTIAARRLVTRSSELYASIGRLADDMAEEAHRRVDDADAIEWGRAVLTASAMLAGIQIRLSKAGVAPEDMVGILLNALGWAGADLMGGS